MPSCARRQLRGQAGRVAPIDDPRRVEVAYRGGRDRQPSGPLPDMEVVPMTDVLLDDMAVDEVVSPVANAIEVRGVEKRYGTKEVLRGVDFDVRTGEVFCVLGPNGAGKTTILEILEGFRDPTAGSVRVLGFDPKAEPLALRQRVGVVLQ